MAAEDAVDRGLFVAKFRQRVFFSDKLCKVWYYTYKRGAF